MSTKCDSCKTCRFHIAQSCRRHAPTIRTEGMYGTKWPTIVEAWRTWCGDHELREVEIKLYRCPKCGYTYAARFLDPAPSFTCPNDDTTLELEP